MQSQDRLTSGARIVVSVARVANRIFLFSVTAGLLLSWVFAAQFADLVSQSMTVKDLPSALIGLRLTMVLGIGMAIAADRLFLSLTRIIASASTGDPFIAANVGRLQRIGWCLLALQLCEIPAALIASYFPALGSAAPSSDISVVGWISVLMVFVLARVFAAGSAMRNDLEGTV